MREGGDMMVLRPAVAKALQLTAEQQAQMTSVAVASSNEMSGLREQMQKLARKQAALMGAEPVDETAVLALADDIGKVRSEMAKVQVKQMLAVRKILTPEQRLKMREKMKNNMGKHEGKRPGPRLNKGEKRPGGEAPPPPAAAPPLPAAE
jgi:Spy/CpxP family protein refolding chaperone